MKGIDSKPQFLDSWVTPRFTQPASFMRAPFATDDIEIALVGCPFDLGSANRAGTRHGPAQIREMSRLIRKVNGATGVAPFSLCRVGDAGDTPISPFDAGQSLEDAQSFYADLHARGIVPISAGGDHTVPLPVIRAIASTERPLAVVHFDAHSDTWDTLHGNRYNNATPFRRLIEEGLIDPKRLVQVGIRGTLFAQDDLDWPVAQGVRVITMDEYEDLGRDQVLAEARRIVGDAPVYVTYDVDGLDPVYCPGTGSPEPGGLSMRDSQVIIRGLRGLDVVGGDVCEVSPPLDPAGHTALNAANLMFEILCVAAEARAARPDR